MDLINNIRECIVIQFADILTNTSWFLLMHVYQSNPSKESNSQHDPIEDGFHIVLFILLLSYLIEIK